MQYRRCVMSSLSTLPFLLKHMFGRSFQLKRLLYHQSKQYKRCVQNNLNNLSFLLLRMFSKSFRQKI